MVKAQRVGAVLLALSATVAMDKAGSFPAGGPPGSASLSLPGGARPVSIDPPLTAVRGTIQVVVGLVDPPLAVAQGGDFKKLGGALSAGEQRAYLRRLAENQDRLAAQVRSLGGRELARVA